MRVFSIHVDYSSKICYVLFIIKKNYGTGDYYTRFEEKERNIHYKILCFFHDGDTHSYEWWTEGYQPYLLQNT